MPQHLPIKKHLFNNVALFALGFRPFFLGAGLFALAGMLVWMSMLTLDGPRLASQLPVVSWHAHEMLYGYSMAVIAGFLLTAARNWTGIQTLSGWTLALLFMLWAIARVSPFLNSQYALEYMAAFDLLFATGLWIALAVPIIRVRQWRQLGILIKVLLLGGGNLLFYLGVIGFVENGVHLGLYTALYLIIALILTMSRRLIPFFTEHSVSYEVKLRNRRWLDIAGLLLFLFFFVADVFVNTTSIAAALAVVLAILHSIRLTGWYTPGIWRNPLLWSLYAGYAFIITGFVLYAAGVYTAISRFLSVHAFAVGGIGLISLSMMARVSLGHTGRNVHTPPAALTYLLIALVLSTMVRVALPLIDVSLYLLWIKASQILWAWAFAGFIAVYTPFLVFPRKDGQPG